MNYEELRKKLMLLDVEEIARFRDEHPVKPTLAVFCNNIISDKIHLFFHTIFPYDFLLSV